MQMYSNKVDCFLKKYRLDCGCIKFDYCCDIFRKEMEKGLAGKDSTLLMIPTCIDGDSYKPTQKTVIALDAGGTKLRSALIRFDSYGNAQISDFTCVDMPGTKEAVTKSEFYKTVAATIAPLCDQSDTIGFCFSYAIKPLPSGDAQVIALSKNIRIEGIVGDKVGDSLNSALQERGLTGSRKICVVNDAVTTLLSGMSGGGSFDSCVGFILGTGTNTCYIEKKSKISKAFSANVPSSMLINMESGSYGKFSESVIDAEYAKSLGMDYDDPYERMVSGRYQGGLMLAVLKRAANDGLFSAAFSKRIFGVADLNASDIDNFLFHPYGEGVLAGYCDGEEDRITLYRLADALADRAAKFAAINLTAVILHTDAGGNPCRPVRIVAEGSVFYNSKLFADKLRYYLIANLNERYHRYCEFIHIENSSLIGAGIAGLIRSGR